MRQPEEEGVQIPKDRMHRRFAQPLARSSVQGLREPLLESNRLLAMEGFKVSPARRLLEAGNRLQHPIDSCGVAALRLFQIENVISLNSLIFRIGFRHAAACLSGSQFREGEAVPIRRSCWSANWTATPGIFASSSARQTCRCMTVSHASQKAFKFPDLGVRTSYSTNPRAGRRGSRQRKQ